MFVCTKENESIDEQFAARERFIEDSLINDFQQKVETERSKDLFLEKKVFEREREVLSFVERLKQSLNGFMNTNMENWTSLIDLILDELALQ